MEKTDHKNEVNKLNKLELELVNLISETNNVKLMKKFMDWQTQRGVCNQGFIDYLEYLDSLK